MLCKDARDVTYEKVTVFGKPMLFTDMRIDRETLPEGLHAYDVRHDDKSFGDPVSVEPWVIVNFFGTLVTREALDLDPVSGSLPVDAEKDWWYDYEECRLGEF